MTKAKSWKAIVTEKVFGSGGSVTGKTVHVNYLEKTYNYVIPSTAKTFDDVVKSDIGFYIRSAGGTRFINDDSVPYKDSAYSKLLYLTDAIPDTIYVKDESIKNLKLYIYKFDESAGEVIAIPENVNHATLGDIASLTEYGILNGANNKVLTLEGTGLLLENKTTHALQTTAFTDKMFLFIEE